MTGKFNTMSKNTAFLLCTILAAASINSDAAGEFPYYNGGSHSITNNETTTGALWLGDQAETPSSRFKPMLSLKPEH